MSEGGQHINLWDKVMLGDDQVKSLMISYPWVARAVNDTQRYEGNSSIRTAVEKDEKYGWIVFPTIRKGEDGLLNELPLSQAWSLALKNQDFISVPSYEAGEYLSRGLSNWQGKGK